MSDVRSPGSEFVDDLASGHEERTIKKSPQGLLASRDQSSDLYLVLLAIGSVGCVRLMWRRGSIFKVCGERERESVGLLKGHVWHNVLRPRGQVHHSRPVFGGFVWYFCEKEDVHQLKLCVGWAEGWSDILRGRRGQAWPVDTHHSQRRREPWQQSRVADTRLPVGLVETGSPLSRLGAQDSTKQNQDNPIIRSHKDYTERRPSTLHCFLRSASPHNLAVFLSNDKMKINVFSVRSWKWQEISPLWHKCYCYHWTHHGIPLQNLLKSMIFLYTLCSPLFHRV